MSNPSRRLLAALSLSFLFSALCGCNKSTETDTAAPADEVATAPKPRAPKTAGNTGTNVPFEKLVDFKVEGPVAEISAVTPDGKTLFYTDSSGQKIGIVDLSQPQKPSESTPLKAGGEPTSVAVAPDGKFAIAVVHGKPDHALIIDPVKRTILRQITLPGQPDCIQISPDGKFAAIAIENERQDMKKPMPQAPAGMLAIIDLKGAYADWKVRTVPLANLPLRFPTDPEPEYISIDRNNHAAVTLQENNGIAIIDLAAGKVLSSWTAGKVTHAADLKKDDKISLTDTLKDAPREPDSVALTPAGNLITANEGDYDLGLKDGQYAGGRNWTIFDRNGKTVWDAGSTLEEAVVAAGLYKDKRSNKKGVEPEGAAVAYYGSQPLAFIGMERAGAVAVYDITDEEQPKLFQVLQSGEKPEGLLPIPQRSLFVSSNEGDGTISIYVKK